MMAAFACMILPDGALRGTGPDVSLTVIARESGDPATAEAIGPIPAKRERCPHDPCRDRRTGPLGRPPVPFVPGQNQPPRLLPPPTPPPPAAGEFLPRHGP